MYLLGIYPLLKGEYTLSIPWHLGGLNPSQKIPPKQLLDLDPTELCSETAYIAGAEHLLFFGGQPKKVDDPLVNQHSDWWKISHVQ